MLKQPLSKTQAYPAHAVVSDILSSALKKRAEPAFTSAKVCHASKSCSRGRFCAISYMLKKTSRCRSFSLRQPEVFPIQVFTSKRKRFQHAQCHNHRKRHAHDHTHQSFQCTASSENTSSLGLFGFILPTFLFQISHIHDLRRASADQHILPAA